MILESISGRNNELNINTTDAKKVSKKEEVQLLLISIGPITAKGHLRWAIAWTFEGHIVGSVFGFQGGRRNCDLLLGMVVGW